MPTPELNTGVIVGEHIVQAFDHAHRVWPHALDVTTEPDQYTFRALVDGVHEAHLPATLRDVGLIDADLVGPQPARAVWPPQAREGIVDALRQRQHVLFTLSILK